MNVFPKITGNGRWKGISAVAVLAVGQAIAAGIAAFATRNVFTALRDPFQDMPLISLGAIGLSGVAIAVMRISENVVAERVGQDYASELRLKLFRHISRLPARVLAKQRTGGLALRFVGDLTSIRNWVSLGIARLISAGIVLPIAALVLFMLDPVLGLSAVLPIAIGLAIMAYAAPRLGVAHRRLRARRAKLAADMSERIPHAPELRLMGRMSIERRSLLKRTERMVTAAIRRRRGVAFLRSIPDAVSGIAAASLIAAAYAIDASTAVTVAALAAVGLIMQPLRNLAGVWDRHRGWLAARDKCLKLLQKPRLSRPRAPEKLFSIEPQTISFRKASFAGLKNMNITAKAGQKIAIIGPNGAGKSTLLTLASGLEAPKKGRIKLGDRAPSSLSVKERQNMIGYIGPRTPILAGSLRRALTMGVAKKPTDANILKVAESFGLLSVIERSGGLDGRIAEAGRSLSAGEVRRVLLTRASLSEAKLLLLDEPDDALDTLGPTLVMQLLNHSAATALIITHNPEIIRQMDEIWSISDGVVVSIRATDNLQDYGSDPTSTIALGDVSLENPAY